MKLLDKEKVVKDLKSFFENCGGFHDAELIDLLIDFKSKSLSIAVCDPLANFIGFENYRYINYMKIIFEFNSIVIDLQQNLKEKIFLYDIIVEKNKIEIQFSPSGKIKLNLNKNHVLVKIVDCD